MKQENGEGGSMFKGIAVALILGLAGAATYFLIKGDAEESSSAETAAESGAVEQAIAPRAFGTGGLVSDAIKESGVDHSTANAAASTPASQPALQISDEIMPRAFGTGALVAAAIEEAGGPSFTAPIDKPDVADSGSVALIAEDECAEDEMPINTAAVAADGAPEAPAAEADDAASDWEATGDSASADSNASGDEVSMALADSAAAETESAVVDAPVAASPSQAPVSEDSGEQAPAPSEVTESPAPDASMVAAQQEVSPTPRAATPPRPVVPEDLSAPPVRPPPPPASDMFRSWWNTGKTEGFRTEFVGLAAAESGIVVRFSEGLGASDAVEPHLQLTGPDGQTPEGQWTRSKATNVIYWLGLQPGPHRLQIGGSVTSASGDTLGSQAEGVVHVVQ